MAEVWYFSDGSGSWKLNFIRAFNDWEVELVANLLKVWEREKVSNEMDTVSWCGVSGGGYLGGKAYRVLQPGFDPLFPVKGNLGV